MNALSSFTFYHFPGRLDVQAQVTTREDLVAIIKVLEILKVLVWPPAPPPVARRPIPLIEPRPGFRDGRV